ncbi:uncharacterized protein LOC107367242 [Tetranychus urticae]|uniref:Fork-head domain-containing protein n=1 Tax=Tetranychus urticae TaxID=32264 RepID=T1KUA1_TETUR|nr:uncharacterized protein LOC107367242 [Tetranychus urticae]
MDYFSVLLNYNTKSNDYLIDPNHDPILTSSIITNYPQEFIPKLIDFDIPLDEINYSPLTDIEGPYESLLTQLNPVGLSPIPFTADVKQDKITRIDEKLPDENLQDEFDNFADDDYPNDQLIIDCLLEDSCDIIKDFDADVDVEVDGDGDNHGEELNSNGEVRCWNPEETQKRLDEIFQNGENVKSEFLEASLVNGNLESKDFDCKAEKENQTPNVYPETHFVPYSVSSQVMNIFPESEVDNKHEVNYQDDTYKLQSMTSDGSCDSLADVSPFQPTSNSTVAVCCCRKHEKYYRKLLNRKADRVAKDRILVVEYLYIPLDSRSGSYLKPKFSHNILCAFAILCGSDEEMMIEVSGIYSFLCKCFPYFETAELHWKNSLRHSLTTCNWFHKTELHRTAMKGYKWTINWNHKTCLAWEISKQCIKDVTSLYHCLSGPEVCEDLLKVGLLEMEQSKLIMLRQSYKRNELRKEY